MSCCMRDAVTFESRGIPAVILVNDVFEPIAHATAALLDLGPDYVASNIIWLPHPTSNLTPAAAALLIDGRIKAIETALLGRTVARDNGAGNTAAGDALQTARGVVEGLAQSLRADGADLALVSFEDGILAGELRIGELTCDDGSCIMPAEQLAKMVEAMVRAKVESLRAVTLREVRLA